MTAAIGGGVGLVTAAATVIGAYLAFKPNMRTAGAAELTASAVFQQALNEGFAKIEAAYERQVEGLSVQVSSLERLVRDMDAHIQDLEVAIAARGLPVPPRRYGPVALHVVAKEG